MLLVLVIFYNNNKSIHNAFAFRIIYFREVFVCVEKPFNLAMHLRLMALLESICFYQIRQLDLYGVFMQTKIVTKDN